MSQDQQQLDLIPSERPEEPVNIAEVSSHIARHARRDGDVEGDKRRAAIIETRDGEDLGAPYRVPLAGVVESPEAIEDETDQTPDITERFAEAAKRLTAADEKRGPKKPDYVGTFVRGREKTN